MEDTIKRSKLKIIHDQIKPKKHAKRTDKGSAGSAVALMVKEAFGPNTV